MGAARPTIIRVNPHRLPTSVSPRHYELTLRPDLADATFTGTVTIDIDVDAAVTELVLNAIELTIDSVVLDGEVVAGKIAYDDKLERITIPLAGTLSEGSHQLELEFTGILNDKLRGFYRSTYTDDEGVEHVLATTQFESTNARRAFPCWDEPAIKATFGVTLEVPSEMMAVSCQSEVSSTDLGDGRRRVAFAPTPIMSTYLLAFVVGRLEATEPEMAGGVPMRIVHTPGRGPETKFALEAGVFAMDWLVDYFKVPYPGDKIDMIAIPDFAFGAMENLGCVTYREVLLVVDPETTTQPEQQRSVDVIAHELAHMWFGDLVTMEWWHGLWLKEAFATFMEMKVTEAFRPEWDRWVDFGLSRTAAFDVDSLDSTRPIEFEVISPDDAEGMYDVLTYEKGAAVVRMLEQYLGEDEFRAGAQHYIETHSFKNTETHDLWDALEARSDQPSREIMDSWIFQGGYPLVSLVRDGDQVTLSQSRFSYRDSSGDQLWKVPVVLTLGSGASRIQQRVLVDGPSVTVTLDGPAEWIVANTSGSGFYRAAYDPASRAALLDNLDGLEAIERYGLVDDSWALVVGGRLSVADFVATIDRFGSEDDLAVWRRILGALGGLASIATDDESNAIAAKVRELAGPKLDELGVTRGDGDSDLRNELRAALFGSLGTTGKDTAIGALARNIHADDSADASMRAAAVAVIADTGTAAEFNQFITLMESATSPQDERRYMYSLAGFPGVEQFTRMLSMALDGSIRTQDAPYVLGSAISHREHGRAAWDFVTGNWDAINTQYPENSIGRLVGGVRSLSKPADAENVKTFLKDHPVPQSDKQVAQHLERLDINVDFRAREAGLLAEAFS